MSIVFPHPPDGLQGLEVLVILELGGPKVSGEMLDGPDSATSLEV